MSKRYNSLPMWAHYAANANDFIVEFRNISNLFDGDETGVLWEPIKVGYDPQSSGETLDPRSHGAIFFQNFKGWSYEQEVRVVAVLDDCQVISLENGQKIYTVELLKKTISSFICVWNMDSNTMEDIRISV